MLSQLSYSPTSDSNYRWAVRLSKLCMGPGVGWREMEAFHIRGVEPVL